MFTLQPDFLIVQAFKKCRIFAGVVRMDEEHLVTCTQEGLMEVVNGDL